MLSLLQPREAVASIYEIDIDGLFDRGMRGLLTDLDNTLVEWNAPEAPACLLEWLAKVQAKGFKVCILSNNESERVSAFANAIGVLAIHKARKPRVKAYLQALALLGIEPQQAVMVGDQIFTDILGGNRAGLYTILVDPIAEKEYAGTKVLRFLERSLRVR